MKDYTRGWNTGTEVRRPNLKIIRITVTVVLVFSLFAVIDPAEVFEVLRGANSVLLLLSCLFTLPIILCKSTRWFLLAREECDGLYRNAFRSYLAGLTLAVITPLAAGEVGRGLFLRKGNTLELTGKVIFDKLVDLSAVCLFSGAGLLFFAGPQMVAPGVFLIAGVCVFWGTVAVFTAIFDDIPLPAWWNQGLGEKLREMILVLRNVSPGVILINSLIAMVGFSLLCAQEFVIMRSFLPGAPGEAVFYFPIITLSTVLPIGIGGLGVREWVAVILLRQLSIPDSVAFNTFFGHFIIVQGIPALAGINIIGRRFHDRRK